MTARIVRLNIEIHVGSESDLTDDQLVSTLRICTGEGLDDQAGVQRWHTEGAVTEEEEPQR